MPKFLVLFASKSTARTTTKRIYNNRSRVSHIEEHKTDVYPHFYVIIRSIPQLFTLSHFFSAHMSQHSAVMPPCQLGPLVLQTFVGESMPSPLLQKRVPRNWDSLFLLLIRFSSKKVWVDKIFAVVMKKRSIDNAVLP